MKKNIVFYLIFLSMTVFGGNVARAVPLLPVIFSPAALQFATTPLGESSTFLTVTLQVRDTSVPFGPIRLQLSDPQHFEIVSDACTATTLGGSATCDVGIIFKPDLFGHYSSFLVVLDGAGDLGNFVPLEGIGAESGFPGPPGPVAEMTSVSLSADQLTFGSQNPGTTSAAQSVTLINTGSAPLRIQATTFGGDAPYNFARIDSCLPQLVNPGGTCNLMVFFTPINSEPAQAALASAANVTDSPLVINLGGNGGGTISGGACGLQPGASPSLPIFWLTLSYSALVFLWKRRLK